MNREKLYTVLLAPHLSEKASLAGDGKRATFAFKVTPDATKTDIKAAVEHLFKVIVEKVNILNTKPKIVRNKRGLGKRGGWKKAYVSLAEGHNIDFTNIKVD